jgi:hypothetical protein
MCHTKEFREEILDETYPIYEPPDPFLDDYPIPDDDPFPPTGDVPETPDWLRDCPLLPVGW